MYKLRLSCYFSYLLLYQFTLDKVVSVSEERIFGIYSVHIVAGLSSRLWSKLYFGTLTFSILEEQKKRTAVGGVHKLHWQYFCLFWPPTRFTFVIEFLCCYKDKSTYWWYFQYHLPTSSCQRSLWMPPSRKKHHSSTTVQLFMLAGQRRSNSEHILPVIQLP